MVSVEIAGLKLVAKGLPASRLSREEAMRLVAIYEAQQGEIARLNKLLKEAVEATTHADPEVLANLGKKSAEVIPASLKRGERVITYTADCSNCGSRFATPGGRPPGSFCPTCPSEPRGLLVWTKA